MLLKNLEQSLTLLISTMEELDCDLIGTLVNLTGLWGQLPVPSGLMPRQNLISRHNHIGHVLSIHYSLSSA
jgi:hypothetical protein